MIVLVRTRSTFRNERNEGSGCGVLRFRTVPSSEKTSQRECGGSRVDADVSVFSALINYSTGGETVIYSYRYGSFGILCAGKLSVAGSIPFDADRDGRFGLGCTGKLQCC